MKNQFIKTLINTYARSTQHHNDYPLHCCTPPLRFNSCHPRFNSCHPHRFNSGQALRFNSGQALRFNGGQALRFNVSVAAR